VRDEQRPGPHWEQHLDDHVSAEQENNNKTHQDIDKFVRGSGTGIADRDPDEKVPDPGKCPNESDHIPGNDKRTRAVTDI